MKIFVKVKARSKVAGVEKIDDTHFVVRVNALPVDGAANDAVLSAVAEHLDIPKSRIEIVSGQASKSKVLRVL